MLSTYCCHEKNDGKDKGCAGVGVACEILQVNDVRTSFTGRGQGGDTQ
jgi:hypothetical protein